MAGMLTQSLQFTPPGPTAQVYAHATDTYRNITGRKPWQDAPEGGAIANCCATDS